MVKCLWTPDTLFVLFEHPILDSKFDPQGSWDPQGSNLGKK